VGHLPGGGRVALPYEGGTLDVVYGVQVFEYIEPLDTALHEVQRVLRPGGRCAILAAEAEAWLREFDALEQQGAYFFCLTPILTEAVKVG
jgi:ubiquinone/menaquinone biosynthesis C-methylase UbiE